MGSVDVMNGGEYPGSTWSISEFWLETVRGARRGEGQHSQRGLRWPFPYKAFALAAPAV